MKKIFKWTGYVLLSSAILFFILFLNWESITYYTVRKFALFYAGRVDIELVIGTITGNPFSETKLANVSIRPKKGLPQTYNFQAGSITCTYELWNLKEGHVLFLQGLSCRADSPEFSYDFEVDSAQDQAADEHGELFIPTLLPGIDLWNGTVILHDKEWGADLRNVNGILHSAAAGHQLQLDVEYFRYVQDGITRIETGFTSKLSYADEKLSIETLDIGEEEIRATGFIDLSQVDKDYIPFGADLSFAENLLNISGLLDKKLLKLKTGTDNFDIGELQKRLGGSGWDVSGKIRAEADLAVNLETPEELEGSFALDVQDGQVHGVEVETVSAAGFFDSRVFNVSSAEAGTPGNHVFVSDLSIPRSLLQEGELFSIIGSSRAKFRVEITDLATLLKLAKTEKDIVPEAIRPDFLKVSGNLENGALYLQEARALNADSTLVIEPSVIPIPLSKEAFGSVPVALGARLESSNLQGLAGLFGDIPLNGKISADMTIAGSIREPQVTVNLGGEYLGFKEMPLGKLSLQGDMRLVQKKPGKIDSLALEIIEMTQENDSGVLELLSPVTVTWQDDTFSMNGAFQLDGKGEIYTVVSRAPGKEIAVEITTRSLDSDGWLGNYTGNGYFFHGADIAAALKGVPYNTQVEIAGTVSEAGGTGVPFPLAGSFGMQYTSKGIEITEFSWKSHERNQLSITGFLPYDPMAEEPLLDGELVLQGHIDFPALEDIGFLLEPWGISRGSVALDLGLTGSWKQPKGHVLLQAEGLEPPDKMRDFVESPVNITVDLAAQRDSIVLKSASLESVQYSAQANGSWQYGPTFRELLQNHKAELKGEVSADTIVKFKDLNFLRKKLPWIRRIAGDIQAEFHLAGPVNNPTMKGTFSVEDGEVSHTYNFPMLSAVNLQGEFDVHSITIKNMQAEVGGSPANLNGRINRDKEAVELSLQIEGKNVLLFRNNDMRLRGDVQLDVSGPLERLVVKGLTGLTGGYYTGNIDFLGMIGSSSAPVSEGVGFLFSFPDPPLKNAVFDIRITTIEPFRIRNNLIRGVLRPELSLKGTGELPFLVGTVYIDPSRVILPSGRLQVQSGLLRFLEREPDRPQLDLLAQSKVLGYDINVVTRGPIDDPVITLSSSPSLPNDELLLLLLTGQPPKDDTAGGVKSKGSTNVMVYLGRDFLNKWLEDESGASDEGILDRFELDFGRNTTKSGEQTVESTFRLSQYTTGTGKMYYLTAEKDKYDAYNYGMRLVFRFE